MTTPSFDLVDQPWIPCLHTDGRVRELGLLDALTSAHELAEVVDSSPLVTLALHRLLLAVIHRVVDGPRDAAHWRKLWDAGRFDAEAFGTYFDRWRHRFDLFDEEWPFFQVGGLVTVDREGRPTPAAPISRLLVERASGNNATLFSHDLDDEPTPLSPAFAARRLITYQAWSLTGAQGPSTNRFGKHPYSTFGPLTGGVSVLLVRGRLFETLLVNLLRYNGDAPIPRTGHDLPAWERQDHRPPGRVPVQGYLDYLTWPCRYVRLVPAAAGDSGSLTGVYDAPGLALPDEPSALRNPMAAHREHPKRGIHPVRLVKDKSVWRDSGAVFASMTGDGRNDLRPLAVRQADGRKYSRVLGDRTVLEVACFGLANDKAKPLLWRREDLPAPIRLIDDPVVGMELRSALEAAEKAGAAVSKALGTLAYRLLEADDKKPDAGDVRRMRDRMAAAAAFWAPLEAPFHDLLRGLGDDPDGARRDWTRRTIAEAEAAFWRGAACLDGPMARRDRARVLAEQQLRRLLAKLAPETPLDAEETVDERA